MKKFLFLLVLCLVQFINCDQAKKDHYDLSQGEDHVLVVKLIIEKLHVLANETAVIGSRLDDVNKRFDGIEKRLNRVSVEFSNFKTDITKEVQTQTTQTEESLKTLGGFNKRFDEINGRLNATAQNNVAAKSEILNLVKERNDAYRNELNQWIDGINQQLNKSAKEITTFRNEISKTINSQNTSLQKIANETREYSERQQAQIRTLWENGSLEKKSDWTVILRRQDGSVNFNRNWTEYKQGFGNTNSEFFIGLERLHKITSNGFPHELLITLEYFDNRRTYARYDNIVIGSEEEQYVLKELGVKSGDADDSLAHHVAEKFTTVDRDNDNAHNENCAQTYKGPWWFYQCNPSSQLFGPYKAERLGHRLRWSLDKLYDLKFVEIKLRQI